MCCIEIDNQKFDCSMSVLCSSITTTQPIILERNMFLYVLCSQSDKEKISEMNVLTLVCIDTIYNLKLISVDCANCFISFFGSCSQPLKTKTSKLNDSCFVSLRMYLHNQKFQKSLLHFYSAENSSSENHRTPFLFFLLCFKIYT